MKTKQTLDWQEYSPEHHTVSISDGVTTYGARLHPGMTLQAAARDYALGYDFNRDPDDDNSDPIVCTIDHKDGRGETFAFNPSLSIWEFPTDRQYTSY